MLSFITILVFVLFVANVTVLQAPPEDFASWPAAKKEAYFYEHRQPSVRGIELLKRWMTQPIEAVEFLSSEIVIVFPLVWIAAFLGGIWQARAHRRP
jgi:hypothetical protein